MKHIQKIICCLLILIFMISTLSMQGFATPKSVTAAFSSTSLLPGDTVTLTISIDEVYASSLGVSVSCDSDLEIIDGKWLKNGLIASFDPIKNKGAYTSGTASYISGDIFLVTLRAKDTMSTDQTVSVTVVAKNGTSTVLEETITDTLNIGCCLHDFDGYHVTESEHYRICHICGHTESQVHSFDSGTIHKNATCQCEGEIIYKCLVCDKTSTEIVPTLPHHYKNATCEKAAICFDCGTIIEPATGHIDENEDYRCDHCHHYTTDVNNDGCINVNDLNDLLCYLSGSTQDKELLVDLDNNGTVNVSDLNYLLIVLSEIE